jgi:phosphoglycolate phosphatase-like HAD superfamily hydrolase
MHDSQKIKKRTTKIENQDLRILLWDIDGTLLHSTVQGGYKKYFSATMQQIYGSSGNLEDLIPSGMTDTQIMYEALRAEGFTPEQIFARRDELLEVFRAEMSKVLAENGEPYEALAGAREILAETARNPRYVNALLTGNLSVAARLKLEAVGLWHYFADAPNAFGEVSHRRNDLAHEAGRLFNRKYDFDFRPAQFIVIGDTPNDILCARDFGARVVAVKTGRNQSHEKLAQMQPDALLDDLRDTKKVLKILESL